VNEEALAHWGLLCQKKERKKELFNNASSHPIEETVHYKDKFVYSV
jgi:hypothetical protein